VETEQQQKLDALIGKRVIDTLGKPGGLHKVQVRRLWDDHYRVNVLIGEDAASVTIANSYFLEADSDGTHRRVNHEDHKTILTRGEGRRTSSPRVDAWGRECRLTSPGASEGDAIEELEGGVHLAVAGIGKLFRARSGIRDVGPGRLKARPSGKTVVQ
jgi:hypothetical protein